eukprot:148056-Pleurochrysis_carterae.AAC.3
MCVFALLARTLGCVPGGTHAWDSTRPLAGRRAATSDSCGERALANECVWRGLALRTLRPM